MKSLRRRSAGALSCIVVLSVAIASCNLDTTTTASLLAFPPAWKLESIDGQILPDTLALVLQNSAPGTEHKIEAAAMEFAPSPSRVLRWTLVVVRLTDSARFQFAIDASYVQFGADSIVFPRSNLEAPEFFGRKRADTLTVVSIWSGDSTTAALLVGGSHTFRFIRDTTID